MTVRHERVSIGTSATNLAGSPAGRDGQALTIQNPSGGVNVYIGGSTVTTTDYGYLLAGGEVLAIDLIDGETVYGIVATSTQTVNVLRQGV